MSTRNFRQLQVDYVKLDGCHSDPATMEAGYAEFGSALRATGRPIVYQCEWPLYQSHHGIQPNYTAVREVCNLWRNFYDVQDNWPSVQNIIDFYGDNSDGFLDLGGPGGWNDPDMLVIGHRLHRCHCQLFLIQCTYDNGHHHYDCQFQF